MSAFRKKKPELQYDRVPAVRSNCEQTSHSPCPECGHMLPGEERWESVEPPQRLVDRVPPLVLGSIIASPIAVVFFFLFKNIILPMSESAAVSKHANAISKETKGAAPKQMAKDVARVASCILSGMKSNAWPVEDILTRRK